jgi:hypothetical protein
MSYFARNISSEELGRLLSAIEKSGVKFTNATPSYSEPSGWKTELPVSFSPFGKALILDSVDVVEGDFPLKNCAKPNVKFFEAILKQISPYAIVGVTFHLNPKTIPLERISSSLSFRNGKIFIGLGGYASHMVGDKFTKKESLEKIIGLAKLPVSVQEESPGKFIFRLTQAAGELDFTPPNSDTPIPYNIDASLPGKSLADITNQYCNFIQNTEFSPEKGEWFVSTIYKGASLAKIDQMELLKKIGQAGFPSKKVEVYFKWHLRDYKDFKELARIAKLIGTAMDTGNAAAQLLDFEFAKGKTCRLVTECNKKGVFKTWFNTETDDDLVILRKFLKKLKVAKKP